MRKELKFHESDLATEQSKIELIKRCYLANGGGMIGAHTIFSKATVKEVIEELEKRQNSADASEESKKTSPFAMFHAIASVFTSSSSASRDTLRQLENAQRYQTGSDRIAEGHPVNLVEKFKADSLSSEMEGMKRQ